jgi:hypothetical protein
MIEQYTERNLTYEIDVLRGLKGVLNAFAEQGVYSFWGVPANGMGMLHPAEVVKEEEAEFIFRLIWYIENSVFPKSPAVYCERRQGFPSWSWCGWKGAVSHTRSRGDWNNEPLIDPCVAIEMTDGTTKTWEEARHMFASPDVERDTSMFIHITAKCVPMELLPRLGYDDADHEREIRIVMDATLDVPILGLPTRFERRNQTIKENGRMRQLIGILLVEPKPGSPPNTMRLLLIVEQLDGWVERVGVATLTEGDLESIPWVRRTIRLG